MATPTATRRSPHRQPHLKLKALRTNAGMTPNDLAYRAGVSGKTIRMVEAGFIPTPRTQFQIAAVFQLQATDLWPFDRDRQRVAA